MKTIETILRELQEKGFRKSAAREAILEFLFVISRPVSAQEIKMRLDVKKKIFNKTTIYREIETLKKGGYIKELMLRNDATFYELVGTHHHHVTCVSCGDMRDVHLGASLCGEEKKIAKKEGFKILEHSFEFFGLCGKCA